jgi:hypothetical protein
MNIRHYPTCSDEEIIQSIVKQNKNLIEDDGKFKLLKKIAKKDKIYTLIFEVDHSTHKLFLANGKINVKWQKCFVYDAFNVLRCFNCSRLGHKSCDCKRNKPTCQKCSGDHKSSECTCDVPKCINCVESNNKFNLSHDTAHPSFSPECPTMLHRLKSLKSFLHYND